MQRSSQSKIGQAAIRPQHSAVATRLPADCRNSVARLGAPRWSPSKAALFCLVLIGACSVLPAVAGYAAPPSDAQVELELITDTPFAAQSSHAWMSVLKELGFSSLRIRAARPTDQVRIDIFGTAERPVYRVLGRISPRQVLQLPGGQFTTRDAARLRSWLATLKADGPEGITQPRAAFGLTKSQLVAANRDLSQPIPLATENRPTLETVRQVAEALRLPLVLEPGVETRLSATDAQVRDELKGVTAGTALAAMLRPAGLVLIPERTAGRTEYRIGLPREGEASWPIGWPAEKRPKEALPVLFEMLNVELDDITLAEALAALEDRLGVPFVYDYQALEKYDVDPAKIRINFPAKRTAYVLLLQKILAQGLLKYELRQDDLGQVFLWITTQRRA